MKTDYKQSAIDRKDERHTLKPEEEFRQPTKSKRDREVIVEVRFRPEVASRWAQGWFGNGDWRKHKAYRNLREAEQALTTLNRKSSDWWEYRIKPEEEENGRG